MRKLLWPSLILGLIMLIVVVFQQVIPILPDLTGHLAILSSKKISMEFWPLILTFKVLLVPIFMSALIIRTFCRYIHESRRSLRKTHFISSFFYFFSVSLVVLFFTFFTYMIITFSKNPGNALFFVSKKSLSVKETFFLVNALLTISLNLNAIFYIATTYIIESLEMKRINRINDIGTLMLDSSYISRNLLVVVLVLIVYFCSAAGLTVLLYFISKSFELLLQLITYSFLFSAVPHLMFIISYMSYTNVSFEKAKIAGEEK